MEKIKNAVCVGLGFLFLIFGTIGVILPILPTTPFLLLAAFFFASGSKRFHHWFLSTKLYRKHIGQMVEKKAMTGKSKLIVLLTISIMLVLAFFIAPVWQAKVFIAVVWLIHIYYFLFRIKTIREKDEILTD